MLSLAELGFTPPQEFRGLDFTGRVASRALLSVFDRMTLEKAHIPIRRLPIGGNDVARDVETYFKTARQGYRLWFQMGETHPTGVKPERFIREVGRNGDDLAAQALQELGLMSEELTEPEDKMSFSVFQQFVAAIAKLRGLQSVTFYDLNTIPPPDIAPVTVRPSNWNFNYDSELFWQIIVSLEGTTQEVIWKPGRIGAATSPRVLAAGHFFAANLDLLRRMQTGKTINVS